MLASPAAMAERDRLPNGPSFGSCGLADRSSRHPAREVSVRRTSPPQSKPHARGRGHRQRRGIQPGTQGPRTCDGVRPQRSDGPSNPSWAPIARKEHQEPTCHSKARLFEKAGLLLPVFWRSACDSAPSSWAYWELSNRPVASIIPRCHGEPVRNLGQAPARSQSQFFHSLGGTWTTVIDPTTIVQECDSSRCSDSLGLFRQEETDACRSR